MNPYALVTPRPPLASGTVCGAPYCRWWDGVETKKGSSNWPILPW
jgi:hypothetical protein